MKKPTQLEAFDALYILASGDGREAALFGDSIELARPAFIRTLVGNEYPTFYLEFPLMGKPCFDILSVYGKPEPGAKFEEGAGFGYQGMIDWFSGVDTGEETASCGIEIDTSSGETEKAGVYLQQRTRHDLVAPFLESVGEAGRAKSYQDVLARMPKGWPPAYVGLFPGREGTPLRIGGYMNRSEQALCVEDPAHLARCFDEIGFSAYDDDMLARCAEFMRTVPAIDFQFDIMPDGSLGDVFGLSLSFNEAKPRIARECMATGYGAELMEKLQSWGLVDDRWKLIADATIARHVPIELEDGSEGRFALCVQFNYAKVKFKNCVPQPAKFYFACKAGLLEE